MILKMKNRKWLNRLLIIWLWPVVAAVWMLGWALAFAGAGKYDRKTKRKKTAKAR